MYDSDFTQIPNKGNTFFEKLINWRLNLVFEFLNNNKLSS